MKRSWKTTLMGFIPLGLVILKMATGVEVHIPGLDLSQTIGTVAGLGLMLAKDHDKTGV